MLKKLTVRGFKSLADVSVDLKPLTVLFGPNSAGKSNFIEAVSFLSQSATAGKLSDVLSSQPRGYPAEFFALPAGGVGELMGQATASFEMEAALGPPNTEWEWCTYRVEVEMVPESGLLKVVDEKLDVMVGGIGWMPFLHQARGKLIADVSNGPDSTEAVPGGMPHTLLSDQRYSRDAGIDRARREFGGWRTYYLDPFGAMRSEQYPMPVDDVGRTGENLTPFLNRLMIEHKPRFEAVVRALRRAVPSVEDVVVDLHRASGILELQVVQDGTRFSARLLSEGTLRVLTMCAIAANPWAGSLVALEEPENGVHPRRLDVIADLVCRMAEHQQVLVTTHSPRFVARMMRERHERPESVAVLAFRRRGRETVVRAMPDLEVMLADSAEADAVGTTAEDGRLEEMLIRGWFDG
jgi:predicted ATPase